MLAVQALPCRQMENVLTKQPLSQNRTVELSESTQIFEGDVTLLDQNSAFYFKHLIKKYRRQMGDVDNSNVCSGGLQQYLIKQGEKKERQRLERESTGQEQSRFEQLPVDVRLHIFSFLTASDLCRSSRVCRSWYDITEDNLLWAGLLERDIKHWNMIGHNTNPAMYKEVNSDWSNKEIYLRCSPEVTKLMHQQNALFSNISSMLRYFLPKKTPLFAMFGPGLESNTSGLVRKIMEDSEFQSVGMFPGKFEGVGGGFTLKSPAGSQFNLSVMYSASKREREQANRDRNHGNKFMRVKKNTEGEESYELLPNVQDFCRTVDGFIYVVDSSPSCPAVESGLNELLAMVSERWSATHVPVLVLSTIVQAGTPRLPCCDIVERLKLADLNRPWQVRDCSIDTREGVLEGFTWLAEQTQRK
ncbi:F-box only protein 4-like [Ruditapes philippinarum]|uniref:F-box only protein 4-like n=1 Tax=Ruditapes philippinarum TaxID=129788 RepID=UPI00295B24A9|nr:F-box only protein 4-like [Ruditapes philippinarum]